MYGLAKKSLRWQANPAIRGTSVFGTALKGSPYKEPTDDLPWPHSKIEHGLRDIEFKTNLYDYKNDFEKVINELWPNNRRNGFRTLINDITDSHPISSSALSTLYWVHSITRKNLKRIYELDRPKFIQYVKELYKLIFQ